MTVICPEGQNWDIEVGYTLDHYPAYTTLEGPNGKFLEAIDRLQELTFLRVLHGRFWAMNEFCKDEMKEYIKIINQFVYPLVAKALEKKRVRGDRRCDVDDRNLVDHLADATNDAKLIRDQVGCFHCRGHCELTILL